MIDLRIIDVNGKEREVISIKKMTQQVPDAVHGGIAATAEYVEVEILGKNRTWKEWYPIDKFRENNPLLAI